MTQITLPSSLERIEDEAFANCKALTDISGTSGTPAFHFTGTAEQWEALEKAPNMKFNSGDDEEPRWIVCSNRTTKIVDAVIHTLTIKTNDHGQLAGRGDVFKVENETRFEYIWDNLSQTVEAKDDGYCLYHWVNTNNEIIGEQAKVESDMEIKALFYKPVTIGDIGYLIDDTTNIAVVGYYYGTDESDVIIPSTINVDGKDYVVTELAPRAFKDKSLQSISIPDSVTKIGYLCFDKCSNLETVILSKNVDKITRQCFQDCGKLTTIKSNDDKPIQASIFEDKSFYGCGLGEIDLSSATFIGEQAFMFSHNLTRVTFSDKLITLKGECFFECDSLSNKSWDNTPGVHFSGTIPQWESVERGPAWIGGAQNINRILCEGESIPATPKRPY